MDKIELKNALPEVFASRDDIRSEIWHREVTFERGHLYLVEAGSGTGKSSLCSYIIGYRNDYQGIISFDGKNIRNYKVKDWVELRKRSLSHLFQELRLFPELTAYENVAIKNNLTGFKKKKQIKTSDFYKISISTIALIFLIIYFYPIISDFFNSDVIDNLLSRVDYYDGSDTSGGRGKDFIKSLSYLNPMFLSVGCGIEGFVTEIGHMYILFMYGLPVYIYFIYILFWRKRSICWRRLIPLIPMFAGFTMNIAIIDQKYLLILLFTSAYLSISTSNNQIVNEKSI